VTTLRSRLSTAIAAGVDLLAGYFLPCPACATRGGAPLCPSCQRRSGIGREPALSEVADLPLHYVGAYHGLEGEEERGRRLSPLGRALVAFKDRGDRYAGRCLARLFADRCAGHARYVDAILPVPPDLARMRRRGFAPASWLAFSLSKGCGVPVKAGALRRLPGHAAQRGLGGTDRRSNVRGLFALGDAVPRGYSVVLVDDVVTTGATLDEAASCLERGGVTVAFAAVLACADRRISSQCRSKTALDGTKDTAESAS
jgi:ComF family protein